MWSQLEPNTVWICSTTAGFEEEGFPDLQWQCALRWTFVTLSQVAQLWPTILRYVCSQLSLETKNPKHHWGVPELHELLGNNTCYTHFSGCWDEQSAVRHHWVKLGAPGSSLVSGGASSLSSGQWRKCLELGSLARQQEIEVNVVLM